MEQMTKIEFWVNPGVITGIALFLCLVVLLVFFKKSTKDNREESETVIGESVEHTKYPTTPDEVYEKPEYKGGGITSEEDIPEVPDKHKNSMTYQPPIKKTISNKTPVKKSRPAKRKK